MQTAPAPRGDRGCVAAVRPRRGPAPRPGPKSPRFFSFDETGPRKVPCVPRYPRDNPPATLRLIACRARSPARPAPSRNLNTQPTTRPARPHLFHGDGERPFSRMTPAGRGHTHSSSRRTRLKSRRSSPPVPRSGLSGSVRGPRTSRAFPPIVAGGSPRRSGLPSRAVGFVRARRNSRSTPRWLRSPTFCYHPEPFMASFACLSPASPGRVASFAHSFRRGRTPSMDCRFGRLGFL